MASEPQKGTGAAVILRERFSIFPGSPLPEFATPSAQAFICEDRREAGRPLFALVVRPGFPPRLNAMRALKGLDCPGLLQLVEWGVIDWPPANRKVMAVVYDRPLGGRVMTAMTGEFRRVEQNDVVRKVMNPMTSALKALRGAGITHRAIRPTNMFWATAEKDRIVLGDCATVPPGYEQPALLEPVESAMCHPAGRGPGNYVDDSYAFGASLVVLLHGRSPRNAEDDPIIRQKIIQGSYTVLVGDERMPVPIIEVLRGLLCDDPNERWSVEALELWLAGRRLSPLLSKTEKRASRSFNFMGKEYYSDRELAVALSRNFEPAAKIILDGSLELWLRRSLDQKERATAVSNVMHSAVAAAQEKRSSFDMMVAKACMVLDQASPIRYKGVCAMPDGLGSLLAMTMIEGGDVRMLVEALTREAAKAWFETRDTYNPDNSVMETNFRDQKTYLERGTLSNGIERVLYELNDSMPCLSPHTVDDYVLEIRDLLPALNSAAKKAEGKGWPVDRHIAAFIAVRSSFDIERQMAEVCDPNPERATLGMLNLLALIQWRLGQGGLFGLGGWVASLMQPAINSYYSREKRKELEKEIPRLAREGSLVDLSRLLDSPEERAKDLQGFAQAQQDWLMAAREIADIDSGNIKGDERGLRAAQQIAALISVSIALVTVSLLMVARFF